MFRRFLDSSKSFVLAVTVLVGPLYATSQHVPMPDESARSARILIDTGLLGKGATDHERAANAHAAVRILATSLAAGDPRWGLLLKNGGTTCSGFACDHLSYCNGTVINRACVGQADHVDVVSANEWTTAGPTWIPAGPIDRPRIDWFPAPTSTGPAPIPTPTPVPVPQPVDLTPLLNRLAALEEQLADLRAQDADIRALVAASDRDLRAIIAALPTGGGAVPCSQLPKYRGSGWFGVVISTPQCK